MATIKNMRRGARNVEKISGEAKVKAIKRLLSYVFKYYPWQFALVILFVLLSSLGGVVGSYFVGNVLIDSYIKGSINYFDPSTNAWVNNFNNGLINTPTSGLFKGIPFGYGIAEFTGCS